MEDLFNISLIALVYKTNLSLKGILQRKLKKYNITPEQFTILQALYIQQKHFPEEKYNQKILAVKCFKDQASLTRTLDILERNTLLVRQSSPRNRREFLISLTDGGLALLEQVLPVVYDMEKKASSLLSETKAETLRALLQELSAKLDNL